MRAVLWMLAFSSLLAPPNALSQLVPGSRSRSMPGSMDVHWNPGAPDCSTSSQPPLQVHAYNSQTFIFRENPCVTAEAPFMYLLIGDTKALLIDTGDVADPKLVPLASTVFSLLPGETASKLPLLIVHTHGHLDHRLGDSQFRNTPNVEIVPTDLDHVRKFFAFSGWPNGIAEIDLGNRMIDVLPTPGHYPSEVSYYDGQTGLFFSGDFFLPGRLIIDDASADLASARRVAEFIKDRPITHVLGGHIELDANGGQLEMGFHYHPREHVLQLSKQDLLALHQVIARFNGFYTRDGIFVMYSQSKILWAIGLAFLAILVAIAMLLRCYLRRRRRKKAQV